MVHPSSDPTSRQTLDAIVGATELIREARRLVALAASRGSDVLVSGETGTGKELVARAIHTQGAGAKGPFLCVEGARPRASSTENCSARNRHMPPSTCAK